MFLRTILLLCFAAKLSAQPPRLVLPIGHANTITAACFSADGKYVVTGSEDNTVKLWEAQTGMLLNEYNGHKNTVRHVAFSKDGSMIISADDGQVCKWWSLKYPAETGDTAYSWPTMPKLPYAPESFSNDDNTRSAVVKNDTLFVFYGPDTIKIAAIRMPYMIIEPFFSPDGNFIFSSTPTTQREQYNHVIYNIMAGTALDINMAGLNFQFSPDSKKLLSINDKEVMLWDPRDREIVSVLKGSASRPVDGPVFNADNKRIITVDQYGSIRTWFSENGTLEPAALGKTMLSLTMSNDKKNIIKSTEDSAGIDIVEIATNRITRHIQTGKPTDTFSDTDLDNPKQRNKYVSSLPIGNVSIDPRQTRLSISTRPPGAGLWNLETGKFLNGYLMSDYASENYWSADGKKWLITAKIQPPMICDGLTGLIIDTLKFKGKTLDDYRRKRNKEHAALSKILNTDSARKRLQYLTDRLNDPYFAAEANNKISPADSSLLALNDHLQNLANPDQLWQNANYITATAFSPDGNMVVAGTLDGSVTAWATSNGKELYCSESPDFAGPDPNGLVRDGTNPNQNAWINSIVFNHDATRIATASWDHTVKLRDAASGKLIANIKDHRAVVNEVQFSPDGKELLSVADTGAIKIWTATDGQYLGELRKPFNSLSGIQFSSDGEQVASTSSDNCMNVWDVPSRQLLYSFFQVDSNDYMYILPSGYYKASGAATKKLHYVTKDLDVMTFEQLDVKYNRPDKVLEATGCTNKALIGSYRNAYHKRLQKLGIDSSSFNDTYSMPVADIINRDAIHAEQKNENLPLHIKATDSIFKLDRFNVWINEVPLFGIKGINIRKEDKHNLDTSISVVLSNGKNRIETSVTNINGIESYRKPLLVKYNMESKETGKVYFIGVGINHFADSSYDLRWCVQDIKDLAATMKLKYGNRLVIVDTMYDEKATRTNIRSLKKKLLNTTVNDKVIFSYSGHGLLSKEYDYYISSYTTNFSDPQEGGIPYDEIENMLDSIPARKKILLLDACHSGEVDKEEMKKIETASSVLSQNHTAINASSRGVIVTSTDSVGRVGLQNSFDLMQSLFVNVGKGTGAIIISASGGVQFAQERSELGHGVFTYSVIEAMKKYPVMKVASLREHIYKRVMELTDGLQKPTTRSEPVAVDWEL